MNKKSKVDTIITAKLEAKNPGMGWKKAQADIPRSKPATDAVMATFKLKDGTQIFAKEKGQWIADTAHYYVRTGYTLANDFTSENGGMVTHQMVAMFTLAAEADHADNMTYQEAGVITAGYEEGSAEEKRQKVLQKKYPNITAAILSFF